MGLVVGDTPCPFASNGIILTFNNDVGPDSICDLVLLQQDDLILLATALAHWTFFAMRETLFDAVFAEYMGARVQYARLYRHIETNWTNKVFWNIIWVAWKSHD